MGSCQSETDAPDAANASENNTPVRSSKKVVHIAVGVVVAVVILISVGIGVVTAMDKGSASGDNLRGDKGSASAVEYDDFFSSIQSGIGDAKSDVVSLKSKILNWDAGQRLPDHQFWDGYAALIRRGEKEHDQRASEALSVLGKLQEQLDCSLVSGYDSLVGSFNPVTHEYDLETLRAFCLGPLTTYESSCNKVLNI